MERPGCSEFQFKFSMVETEDWQRHIMFDSSGAKWLVDWNYYSFRKKKQTDEIQATVSHLLSGLFLFISLITLLFLLLLYLKFFKKIVQYEEKLIPLTDATPSRTPLVRAVFFLQSFLLSLYLKLKTKKCYTGARLPSSTSNWSNCSKTPNQGHTS